MKVQALTFASLLTLTGCVLLGRQGPPLVPIEDDPTLVFPAFFERGTVALEKEGTVQALDGELLRALTLATQDFLPPASKDLPCALRPEAQSYRVIRQGDVFFIHISENLAHCGHAHPALDSGVRYAIHRDGRILRRRLDGQPEFARETPTPHDDSWIQAEPGVTGPIGDPRQSLDGGTPPDAGPGPG